MSTLHDFRRFVLPVVVVAIGCIAAGCNSGTVRQAEQVAGEGAAYAALQSALTKAGITSASSMTDAVRLAVESKNYGGAAAAFAVALAQHNSRASQKLKSAQVVGLMRQAIPTVRNVSPKVGAGLQDFCDYVAGKH